MRFFVIFIVNFLFCNIQADEIGLTPIAITNTSSEPEKISSGQWIFEDEFNKLCSPSITTISGSNKPETICSGKLIFEDNFDKLSPVWKHEKTLSGGGNWEFQWYDNNRSNSFIKDGHLHIKPTLTSDFIGEDAVMHGKVVIPPGECTDDRFWGCERSADGVHIINPIRSAKLTTKESFSFKYGVVEIRAKMPAGDWIWPAVMHNFMLNFNFLTIFLTALDVTNKKCLWRMAAKW